ncbi:hypothetical protein EPN28_02600 [Patescibacteria group bacterium]|nr:MAG: hypothetical protein EPN28_02600 [Patescibacteria group bacterium]
MQKANQNTTIQNTLKELGLGENEALLYEVLLKTPDATIPQLRQQTNFSRTMLYYVLDNLIASDLATEKKPGAGDKSKKTMYNAAPPEKLEDFVADQEKEIQRQKAMLGDVLGDLKSSYRLAHHKPGVKFYEGPEGIKEVTFDSLKAKGEIYTFIDMEALVKYGGEMNKKYVEKRIELGIHKKQISLDTPFTRERYKNLPPSSRLLEVRLIPQALNPFKTGMQIYNDTISYSTLAEEQQIGVIIEDKNIAQMQRSLFEYIWNSLPPMRPSPAAPAKVPEPS